MVQRWEVPGSSGTCKYWPHGFPSYITKHQELPPGLDTALNKNSFTDGWMGQTFRFERGKWSSRNQFTSNAVISPAKGLEQPWKKWPAKRQCATGEKDHTVQPWAGAQLCQLLTVGHFEDYVSTVWLRKCSSAEPPHQSLVLFKSETMSDLQQVLGFSSYLFPLRGVALPILTKPGQGRERKGSSKPVPGPGLTQLPHPGGRRVSPSPCKIPHRLCGRLESLVLHHPLQSA